jgi:hypothetical protein
MVTIWTFQHPQLLAYLKAGKTYRPTQAAVRKHGEFSGDLDYPEFRRAYAWMGEQYAARVKPLWKGKALVWAWYKPKPDMRKGMWKDIARPAVLMTLQVDPKRLLVSDFDEWHMVLNGNPVTPFRLHGNSDVSGAQFDAWADEAWEWPQRKKEQTWGRIFQPSHMGDYLQAVLAEIRPSDVVAAKLCR